MANEIPAATLRVLIPITSPSLEMTNQEEKLNTRSTCLSIRRHWKCYMS